MVDYIVAAPLVIAKDDQGAQVYVYQGQPVPANISADEVKRLAEGGFIAKIGSDYPEGDPDDTWKNDELRAYAGDNAIDLGEAKNKAEMLAAINPK